MLKPFTTFFTFLHRNTKFLLTHNPITRRRRSNRSLSSSTISINHSLNPPSSSFMDMGVSNQFKQVFKIIDTNGDGKISAAEISQVLLCLQHTKTNKRKKSSTAQEAEGIIRVLDFNGDGDGNGLIDAKELQRVMVNLGCDHSSLKECKKMIQGVDKNGDGFVDFEEFRSMMRSSFANSAVSNN
ncbi:putative calcium-binding protein CML25 [Senna tora]|uniref:Putative calcium-binding protein CML25 n=1 Tax=Senna tora TaxID=362788 RepID=A0A834TSA7_9FABA|nr:putative calcium-binding protein CML25 [Senna tora]